MKKRGRKRFDFMMEMDNYLYLNELSEASDRSMARELNRIIEKHRKHNDINEIEPASRRMQ